MNGMAITPGDGPLGGGSIKFRYTDVYGTEREAYGILLAVNRRESNREGIIMCLEGTRQRMCLIRTNDGGGPPTWVKWVYRIPGENEGWRVVRLPGRKARDDEGWSGVIMWIVLAGVVFCFLYGSGRL